MKKDKPTPFLLEIGTEEIPARFFITLPDMIQNNTAAAFEKNRIAFTGIRCFATPRRIAVTANILNAVQKTDISEIIGPPSRVAFDAQGKPTKAAEGFARTQGVRVSDLQIKRTERGDYIAAVKETKGEKVSKVLPVIVPDIIRSLHFPKAMRWGYHTLRFARPIQWLLCLYGEAVVKFEMDGIKSGSFTYGHRLLAPGKRTVRKPSEYVKSLKRVMVIADHKTRRELIEKAIHAVAKKSNLMPVHDEALLGHVNFLVEHPHAVRCEFPEEYLQLPPELLITVMKDHQKYFALTRKDGRIVNSFVVISNTNRTHEKAVREGAEKVIRARFEDAKFYYTEDTRTTLSERLEILKGITFHEKIGTVFEKVKRIKALAVEIASLTVPGKKDLVERSAELCKSDLTTGVVREFPELQGIIGSYYALKEGLPAEVGLAIREHYKPLNTGDSIPSSDEGRVLSIADKIDNIVAFFSAGIIPSGSEDPFALRRQAQGIVQILLAHPYPVTPEELLQRAAGNIGAAGRAVIPVIETFILQRIEFSLTSDGFAEDIVKSLLGDALGNRLSLLPAKAKAISAFKREKEASRFLAAIKRVKNILPSSQPADIDTALFSDTAENDLFDAVTKVSASVRDRLNNDQFPGALAELGTLVDPINRFFDSVLVMDKDERIKKNRLALLSLVWNAARTVCDFSLLAENPQ
ncbi:MAG: glycine--tRNA ligase subunit beta [bacterium]